MIYARHLHLYSSVFALSSPISFLFFFFNDTATTEIYTLSLHDALPIWPGIEVLRRQVRVLVVEPHATVQREPFHCPLVLRVEAHQRSHRFVKQQRVRVDRDLGRSLVPELVVDGGALFAELLDTVAHLETDL